MTRKPAHVAKLESLGYEVVKLDPRNSPNIKAFDLDTGDLVGNFEPGQGLDGVARRFIEGHPYVSSRTTCIPALYPSPGESRKVMAGHIRVLITHGPLNMTKSETRSLLARHR